MSTHSILPTIHIGTDHAGFELSRRIQAVLTDRGYTVHDHGPTDFDPDDDYPAFCIATGHAVMRDYYAHRPSFGIVIGGSGNGEAITANKVPEIRAALVWSERTARLARQHNDANVIAVGAREHSPEEIIDLVQIFLEEPFTRDERHQRRIEQIAVYEHDRRY